MRVDLHVLQNMSSGNRILSAFRFLSYPIKIINVIIHKHKISKIRDKKYAVIGVRTFNRKTTKTTRDFLLNIFGVGVSCRKLYYFVVYLYVNGSGLITLVGEERANLSAVVYL